MNAGQPDKATLSIAAKQALQNAKKFIGDARLLLFFRRHAHAYALLIFADEEIAKAYMYIISENDPRILRKVKRHKEKDSLIAEGVKLWASLEGIENLPFEPAHYKHLGEEKNKALYVDLNPNTYRITRPEDIPRSKVVAFKREVVGHLEFAEEYVAGFLESA